MLSQEDIQDMINTDSTASSSSSERPMYFHEHLVMQEFLNTELTYNNSLQLVAHALDDYQPNGLLNEILTSIMQFIDLSNKLLKNFQMTTQETDKSKQDRLSDERTKFMKLFVLSSNRYIELHQQYTRACIDNSAAFSHIDDNIKRLGGTLTLGALLILPVQRGIQCKNLLETILKNTEGLSSDATIELEKNFTVIKNGLQELNDSPKKAAQALASAPAPVPYKFGDYTRGFFRSLTSSSSSASISPDDSNKSTPT